jgi:hypothetical protein
MTSDLKGTEKSEDADVAQQFLANKESIPL